MNIKYIFISIISVLSLSICSHFFAIGQNLTWIGFTQPQEFILLLLRLLFLSLIVERIVELYVIAYRQPGKIKLVNRIDNGNKGERIEATELLASYRAETTKQAGIVGFLIGLTMGLVGIRIFSDVFSFSGIPTLQLILFNAFELFTMGALMAGGSKGINKIVSGIEAFASIGKRKSAHSD
ncbi:hypothetical protein J8L98_23485 [Pseudoalteromonas sp. MMG013]|uniref:hypothetical protein n=1 Tax=Pseudoalteromonas sp. MMG013 TaxID=2822687 RepID=UPI001B3807F1|nr:hypothetical protein [Pseudoalteromonas sp. MMG013]MBQ4864651.1 hypothetical protein [Pseudoalteromonas sp. MMG013]